MKIDAYPIGSSVRARRAEPTAACIMTSTPQPRRRSTINHRRQRQVASQDVSIPCHHHRSLIVTQPQPYPPAHRLPKPRPYTSNPPLPPPSIKHAPLQLTPSTGSISAPKSASRPRSLGVGNAKSGLTPMKSMKSQTQTPAKRSANSCLMALSSANP